MDGVLDDAHAPRGGPPPRRWWPLVLVGLGVGVYGALAGLEWTLHERAHAAGAAAAAKSGGDEVTALAAVAGDEALPLTDRNDAIWALAQLADPRALPALQVLVTGRECDHQRDVCQYELRKAIQRCRGERQPPRWLPLFPHPAPPGQRH